MSMMKPSNPYLKASQVESRNVFPSENHTLEPPICSRWRLPFFGYNSRNPTRFLQI